MQPFIPYSARTVHAHMYSGTVVLTFSYYNHIILILHYFFYCCYIPTSTTTILLCTVLIYIKKFLGFEKNDCLSFLTTKSLE